MQDIKLSRRGVFAGAAASAVAAAPIGRATASAAMLSKEFAHLPVLDAKQAGHLRHIRNLMNRPDGDWGPMASNPLHQDDFTGYMYQLSSMAHAMAQSHYHRLPAASGFFKRDFDNLVRKLQHHDAWSYWFAMSQGVKQWDPSLTEPRTPWWDPVVRENIMYSGHLSHVASLYGYLFDDPKYDLVGSIHFEGFQAYGLGKTVSEYSAKTLNDLIYWQMVENGFMGVACQPNAVFVTCNQFPIWGFRFDDFRNGTSRAEEVVAGFHKAWSRFGGFRNGQEMPAIWRAKQNDLFTVSTEVPNSWLGLGLWGQWALNATSPDYIRSMYPQFMAAALGRDLNGSLIVVDSRRRRNGANNGRQFTRGAAALSGESISPMGALTDVDKNYAGEWGWVSMSMSEQGDPRLNELLGYIDANMNPVWENGGLYYPVTDRGWDKGKFVGVTQTSGNANFAYARLNVPHGLRSLYSKPLERAHFTAPALADVSPEFDVIRASWLPLERALVLTLAPHFGAEGGEATLRIANVKRRGQSWIMSIDGQEVANGSGDQVGQSGPVGAAYEGDALVARSSVRRMTDIVLRWT